MDSQATTGRQPGSSINKKPSYITIRVKATLIKLSEWLSLLGITP